MAIGQFGWGVATGAQVLLVSAGLAATVLAPPARGTMIAIPLTGATVAETVNLAVARGATIEGMGRLAGSVVLDGDRARLTAALRAHGVLLIGAPSGLCGA